MRICFDQIPLDQVSTSMTINAPAAILLLLYELVGEEQGVPSEKLRGTVQNDVLKEYMARGNHSTFAGSLPILKRHNVGAINWGLVQGKAQTHLPWDSWRRPYVDREPAVWFHEVFRNDGTPYDAKETALIKSLTGAR